MVDLYKTLIEKFKARNYLEDLGIHGRIILKWKSFDKIHLVQAEVQ